MLASFFMKLHFLYSYSLTSVNNVFVKVGCIAKIKTKLVVKPHFKMAHFDKVQSS